MQYFIIFHNGMLYPCTNFIELKITGLQNNEYGTYILVMDGSRFEYYRYVYSVVSYGIGSSYLASYG